MSQRLPPAHGSVPGFAGQLIAVVLGLVLVFSVVAIGFVMFFVFMLAGTVFWLIFLARRWWLTRGNQKPAKTGTRPGAGATLEGEFKVVNKDPGDDVANGPR